ncbi:MAG: CPBP family glutamic-type intramembrane protease [Luteolibacter sp.]
MRVSALSDVFKVWVWALGSLVIALWSTPICYNGGKALSELSVTKDFNGLVNKVAAWCGAGEMGDYFKVCWPLAAILLLFPLMEWLRLGNERGGKRVWSVRLPHGAAAEEGRGQPIEANRWGPLHGVAGFCLSFGCFLLIGYTLLKAGSFRWAEDYGKWHEGLFFDIGWALSLAVVMEVFFRRVLLGIFLRAMGVWAAIAVAAAMFGAVYFLMSGFAVAKSLDGEMLSAIELTGTLLAGGDLLMRIVTVFVPWFAFGCVLGWARWRTASVWLPASLLMGWLLADRLFAKATEVVEIPDKLAAFVSAGSVHEGIAPFLGVIAVGGLVHIFTYRNASGREARD